MKFKTTKPTIPNESQDISDSLGAFSLFCRGEDKPPYRPEFYVMAIQDEPTGRQSYPLAGPFDSQQLASEAFNNGAELIENLQTLRFIERAETTKIIERIPLIPARP